MPSLTCGDLEPANAYHAVDRYPTRYHIAGDHARLEYVGSASVETPDYLLTALLVDLCAKTAIVSIGRETDFRSIRILLGLSQLVICSGIGCVWPSKWKMERSGAGTYVH